MEPYAVALHQRGTGRAVRSPLVFTFLEDAWAVEWSPEHVRAITDDIEPQIAARTGKLPLS